MPITPPSYFDSYPGFTLRRGELPQNAFKRLARESGWTIQKRNLERALFQKIIVTPTAKATTATSAGESVDSSEAPIKPKDYFDNYPKFVFRKGELPKNAFKRLAKEQGWSEKKRNLERHIFKSSIANHESKSHDISSVSSASMLDDSASVSAGVRYFSRYEGFNLRDGETLRSGFKRIAKTYEWSTMRTNLERANLHQKVIDELNERLKTLRDYQDLCENFFHPEKLPGSMSECKAMLRTKYINIWDLYEEKYQCFDDFKKFKKYTYKGRVFAIEYGRKLDKLRDFLRDMTEKQSKSKSKSKAKAGSGQ
ncbi:hypothetical protein BGZ46_007964 [Entomortierella lignicola]|nr:hypothetical protein BGZ46_007964 [Entomortierella lignicola]